MQSVVKLRGVSKWFGSRAAVVDVDLDVPAGQCFGVLGPNGAGKTTTMRMIYGAVEASAGQVTVFGIDVKRDPRRVRSRLGVTLQENALIEELSPIDNLRVFGRYHLLREPELAKRADELIDFLELRSHADVPVEKLSGGFQRRLSIAMSLVNRPELLILDEPTTGLDPAVRLSLWGRIRELRGAGTTVLLTTHYMDEAERVCDRVAIMSEGSIACAGAPLDLIESRLAPAALEIPCSPDEEASLLDGYAGADERLRLTDRLILYTRDAAAAIDWIRRRDAGDRRPLVSRPTNLEDVFLAETGASLRDDA